MSSSAHLQHPSCSACRVELPLRRERPLPVFASMPWHPPMGQRYHGRPCVRMPLLCQKNRVRVLAPPNRAALMDGLMKVGMRNRPERQHFALNILLNTYSSDLTTLKVRWWSCAQRDNRHMIEVGVPDLLLRLCLQGMIDDGGDYHITYKLFYNDLQGRNQVPIRFLVKVVGPCVQMPGKQSIQTARAWCCSGGCAAACGDRGAAGSVGLAAPRSARPHATSRFPIVQLLTCPSAASQRMSCSACKVHCDFPVSFDCRRPCMQVSC